MWFLRSDFSADTSTTRQRPLLLIVTASDLPPQPQPGFLIRTATLARALALAVLGAACTSSSAPPVQQVDIGSVTISGASFAIERGYHAQLTAVVRSRTGTVVNYPVVFRSSNENVVTIDGNGKLFAVDTGQVAIVASSVSVTSTPIGVKVVHNGPDKIDAFQYAPVQANSPGSTPDSLRVRVINSSNQLVANARVAFAVTGGGGAVSPAIATTNAVGIASAEWKLGPAAGVNTVTATALGEDDKPITTITPNFTTFSLRTFDALAALAGDKQSGLILSGLPVQPSVRLVDSLNKVRPGVPVFFTATRGGRVATSVVSTGADGVASPGIWTLGDIPGEQQLIAKVEFASVTLTATGTGTPVHFTPKSVMAGQSVTCAILTDDTASCWGEQPKVGDSTAKNTASPTPTKHNVKFTSLAGSIGSGTGHVCGIGVDQSVYCWGTNSLPDTASKPKVFSSLVPVQYPSPLAWVQIAPGQVHNCGLATDQNVYCWGDNSQGQLGDRAANPQRYAAAPVFGGFKFSAVTAGIGHNCALSIDGSVFCWGLNVNGQLGNGTTATATSPTAVATVLTFQQISAGDSFTCGLTTTGRAHCWGNLGGTSSVVTSPRTYASAPTFTSITSGGFHTCALTADGTAYCWGDNSGGQLGDSTATYRPNPTPVVTSVKFKSISAGFGHTCGTAVDNSVLCWGFNKAGELGDSTATFRLTPRYMVLSVTP